MLTILFFDQLRLLFLSLVPLINSRALDCLLASRHAMGLSSIVGKASSIVTGSTSASSPHKSPPGSAGGGGEGQAPEGAAADDTECVLLPYDLLLSPTRPHCLSAREGTPEVDEN